MVLYDTKTQLKLLPTVIPSRRNASSLLARSFLIKFSILKISLSFVNIGHRLQFEVIIFHESGTDVK